MENLNLDSLEGPKKERDYQIETKGNLDDSHGSSPHVLPVNYDISNVTINKDTIRNEIPNIDALLFNCTRDCGIFTTDRENRIRSNGVDEVAKDLSSMAISTSNDPLEHEEIQTGKVVSQSSLWSLTKCRQPYIGPVIVKFIEENNKRRGLVALRKIEAGECLMVVNPLIAVDCAQAYCNFINQNILTNGKTVEKCSSSFSVSALPSLEKIAHNMLVSNLTHLMQRSSKVSN